METTLANFSLGTTGTIPLPPPGKKQSKGTRGPLKIKPEHQSASAKSVESQSSYAKRDDGILVEELKLPEIMLPNQSPTNRTESARDKEGNGTHKLTGNIVDTSRFEPKRQFLQGFQEAVTKKDQFTKKLLAGQFKGKSTYGPDGELKNELIFTTVDGLMWQSRERPSGQITDYIYDDRGITLRLGFVL